MIFQVPHQAHRKGKPIQQSADCLCCHTVSHANFMGLLEAVARGIISTRIYTLKESRDQFISPFPIKGQDHDTDI